MINLNSFESNKYGDYNLLVWLAWTRDAVDKARKKELRKYQINARKAAILATIQVLGDNATATKISQYMLREINTISEFITRLASQGLVKRVKFSKKNKVIIRLTRKGREAHALASKRESIKEIFLCLNNEERKHLRSCFKKLRYSALKYLGMQPPANWPL